MNKQVTIYRAINTTGNTIAEMSKDTFDAAMIDAAHYATLFGVEVYNKDIIRFEIATVEMMFDTSARFGTFNVEMNARGDWRRVNITVDTIVTTKTFKVRKGVISW